MPEIDPFRRHQLLVMIQQLLPSNHDLSLSANSHYTCVLCQVPKNLALSSEQTSGAVPHARGRQVADHRVDHTLRSRQSSHSRVKARDANEANLMGAMHFELAALLRKRFRNLPASLHHVARRELDHHMLAVLRVHRLVAIAHEQQRPTRRDPLYVVRIAGTMGGDVVIGEID